jgi:hypothetical protein
MKIFGFDIGNHEVNSYVKSVWTDESMQANSYRNLGFFTSRHLSSIFKSKEKDGKKFKSTTYSFGIDLLWVRYWIAFNIATEYRYENETPKHKNKKNHKSDFDFYND